LPNYSGQAARHDFYSLDYAFGAPLGVPRILVDLVEANFAPRGIELSSPLAIKSFSRWDQGFVVYSKAPAKIAELVILRFAQQFRRRPAGIVGALERRNEIVLRLRTSASSSWTLLEIAPG